jgi:uncharacterized Tic20 family protein
VEAPGHGRSVYEGPVDVDRAGSTWQYRAHVSVFLSVLIIAAVVAFWVVWILGIVRSMRVPTEAYDAVGRRKPQTVLVVVFLLLIGALYFLLVIQRELTAASDQDAAPA